MSKATENPAVELEQRKYVRLRLPVDPQLKKEPMFVGVNGKSYYVPRGVETSVPYEVYRVIERALKQREDTRDYIDSIVAGD